MSDRPRTTVVGFGWRALVVGSELQLKNYSGLPEMENSK